MNNLFVYLEIEEGMVAEVSLELLTKGRSLANQLNCKLEAIAAGANLDKRQQVFRMAWMYCIFLKMIVYTLYHFASYIHTGGTI